VILEGALFAVAGLIEAVFPSLGIKERLEERFEPRDDGRNWTPPR
jgi:hypothetical protein